MARLLSDKPCEITFQDRISNSKLTLFYRLPATEERVKYSNSLLQRKGDKLENKASETRLKYGVRILTGISEGSFETEKGPLSSDPQSSHYDPAWKSFLQKYAADVVEMLAIVVFESSVTSAAPEEAVDDEDSDKKELAPGAEGEKANVF